MTKSDCCNSDVFFTCKDDAANLCHCLTICLKCNGATSTKNMSLIDPELYGNYFDTTFEEPNLMSIYKFI